MFRKVLIANRGEIACRVARTLKRLGIASVAVYSEADRDAPHVALCDEAVPIGAAPVQASYLNVSALLTALSATGAEAVHPGYGLLSENSQFARAVADRGACFIGPSPEALAELGDKLSARALARRVGVEPPPGTESAISVAEPALLAREAERIGFPLLVKAAAGGGGIGMMRVESPGELERAARAASDRARQAFADDRVYLERYIDKPRHIEVQILADGRGGAVALGERDCSVQRRHQKVVEETPSPAAFFREEAGEARRRALFDHALAIVRAAGYAGAGTVEFVVADDGTPFFLEVNARLQVEHPVTEMVTGLDLVECQLQIAAGEGLPARAQDARPEGHSIEVRLYAEDPDKGFVPQPGKLERLQFPEELAGVRIDAGVREGSEITQYYDPMIAKIIAHGATRAEALDRLERALDQTIVALVGPKGPRATNLGLLRRILQNAEFRTGAYDTRLLERFPRASG